MHCFPPSETHHQNNPSITVHVVHRTRFTFLIDVFNELKMELVKCFFTFNMLDKDAWHPFKEYSVYSVSCISEFRLTENLIVSLKCPDKPGRFPNLQSLLLTWLHSHKVGISLCFPFCYVVSDTCLILLQLICHLFFPEPVNQMSHGKCIERLTHTSGEPGFIQSFGYPTFKNWGKTAKNRVCDSGLMCFLFVLKPDADPGGYFRINGNNPRLR